MKNINKTTAMIAIGMLSLGLILGWIFFGESNETKEDDHSHVATSAAETTWTCSMHPQVRKNEPGKCPICAMDLIPLAIDDSGIDPMAISMSPTAMQLARVQTMVVGQGNAEKSIRLNGKVQADERLSFTQSSHIPGRIEKLYVNFTGDYISQGQMIAHIYSPDLVTAQEELFEAQKIKESQPALFQAAKEKLKNWKLTDKQIEQILASNKPIEQFPILANVSGFVTKKMVNLGDYIDQGQPIYEIADFSKVWILFDVYESDMTWIKKGAKVSYTVQSIAGKNFMGTISYIDPIINPNTRVAKARIEVANTSMSLKPEMFVSGIVQTEISEKSTIQIPKTAVMWTGKRSVVYVMNTTAQGVSFLMREVTLGNDLGDSYVIESGLNVGEKIATNGTFSIDAAAQLAGKPSMMNPEGGVAMAGHNHGDRSDDQMTKMTTSKKISTSDGAKKALLPLFNSYFEMKTALSNDDFDQAKERGKEIKASLAKIEMTLFNGESPAVWMKLSQSINSSVQHIDHMGDIQELRNNFIGISIAVIAIAESFDPIDETLYIQHCPMADDNKGANWLSKDKEILNPYMGKAMLGCGNIEKEI